MNLFKSLKNRKGAIGAIGAISIGMIILILAFALVSVSFVKPVLAEHTATITITPDIANCNYLGNTFTVNVKNNVVSGNPILQVEIYKALAGLSDFNCGPAPTGWSYLPWPGEDRCIYVTALSSLYKIAPGNSLNFTFDAVMSSDACQSEFIIVTVDDAYPQGDRDTNPVYVKIDCTDPKLEKIVGEPKVPGIGFDYWVSKDTLIQLSASDNTDKCDLGIDYCRWQVTIDGVPQGWNTVKDGPTLTWPLPPFMDSNHYLEVECFDKAGNKVTLTENDKADSTPPETTKTFNGPKKIIPQPQCVDWCEDDCSGEPPECLENCIDKCPLIEWIDGVTTVELTPVDPDPTKQGCNIGVDKTWYKDFLAPSEDWCRYPEKYCTAVGVKYCTSCPDPEGKYPKECIDRVQTYCEDWKKLTDPRCENNCKASCKDDPEPELCFEKCVEEKCFYTSWYDCVQKESNMRCCGGWDWTIYDGNPIPKNEESCHVLYYFSVDNIGNVEPIRANCFFVDKTPPEIRKNVGTPSVEGDHKTVDWWITQDTPITLNCKDVGEHPSDDVTIYWSYTVDGGLPVTGSHKGESYELKFKEDSVHVLEFWCKDAVEKESKHDIETFKVDTVPPSIKKTMIGTDHLGECPPGPSPIEPCYVKDSRENGVHIDVTDGGTICAVDKTDCYYELWWMGKVIDSGHFGEEGKDIIFTEDSEHILEIQCKDALGNLMSKDVETFFVDSKPPITLKTYGTPTKVLDGYRWITKDTPITLTTEDKKVGPEKIFVRVTKLDIEDERCIEECDFDGSKDFKEYVVYKNPDHIEFKIPEDSCHLIEFYAVDKLGNIEAVNKQCVFVDNKDPELVKIVGDPSIFVKGTGCENITYDGEAPIGKGATIDPDHLGTALEPIVLKPGQSIEELKSIITDEIPIGKLDVLFLFDLTGSMGGIIGSAKANAISIMTAIQGLVTDAQFGTGSFRDYDGDFNYCGYSDEYGGSGDYPWSLDQDITSDTSAVSTAINTYFASGGSDGPESYARALYESQFVGWRTGSRKVVVIFEDDVPHDCDLGSYMGDPADCYWTNIIDTTGTDPGRDALEGNSDDLTWASVVADLKAAGVSVVTVDSGTAYYSCPEVWQYASDETGGLYATLGGEGLPEKIVALMTEITGKIKKLTLEPKLGFEEWVEWTPEYYTDVEGLDTVNFDVDITVPTDQPGGDYHLYIKVMGDGAILAVEKIFIKVDAPECEGGEDYWWVRDHVTPVTLDCDDSWDGKTPHPVGQETLCYRISFDSPTTPWLTEQYCREFKQGGEMIGDWCCAYVGEPIIDGLAKPPSVYTFTFMEDSVHDLEFYCKDHLGNGGNVVDKEYFHVDSIPPKTTKTYEGPFYESAEGYEFVDTISKVKLEATDGGDICHVDGVKTYYRVINLKEEGWDYCKGMCNEWDPRHPGDWLTYKNPFSLDESCNIIEFYSEDALGNAEKVDWQCVFSDHTEPVTTKTYGKPFFTDGKSDWIVPSTEIHLEAIDPEPHPSGVKETYYRFTLVDDNYCRDETLCQEYDETITKEYDKASPKLMFNIPEESCHLIEYYSVDNVGKVEDVKRQCVFVDNSAPTVDKTISDPKEHWAGDNTFYPGLTDRCWSTDSAKTIECWKITMGNTLNITCTDPEPHPVDHNKICFQIELDGDDVTEKYCSRYGVYNESGDGYCCRTKPLEYFQFTEESQHDLKVKCVDALGNEGKIDEEKFKVEGCTYELCLKKKWNLISVPFTLFNDDPEVVFKEAKDVIAAVWTYDYDGWSTWVPGLGGTLTSIKPGWGYWVLAKEDKCFDIAGSSFAPLEVPPSRDLQSGWNLIGYYGNTMMLDGADHLIETDPVTPEKCIIPWKPVYCALNSLVDTQQGFPRWSSLWNYFNYGGDYAGWKGLDACCDTSRGPAWCGGESPDDLMQPGKGYWIEMDVKDSYAPATNCIWNEDMSCVMPTIFA